VRAGVAGHGAEAVRDAIAASITTLPARLRRSLTWDQGAEMAQHAQRRIVVGLAILSWAEEPRSGGSGSPDQSCSPPAHTNAGPPIYVS